MSIHEEIKAMSKRLMEMFPGVHTVILNAKQGRSEVSFHHHPQFTYTHATEVLSAAGVKNRAKTVVDAKLCALQGKAEGVYYCAYANTMPPTCRIESYVEKVPKQQTVDTGEFIEVQKTRVVCGGNEHETEAATL